MNKGITLISLVITIIVLLILAGVTITMLTGDNGLINKAIEGKIRAEVSEIIESAKIEEAKDSDFVIEGKYAEKLIYDGEGDFLYNPDESSDLEKEIFESMDIHSLLDLFVYSTYTYGDTKEVRVNGFSELGINKINKGITKFTIPARTNDGLKITTIYDSAFKNYSTITEIKVPDTLVTIYNYAFQNCKNLIKVEGSNNITSIKTSAFSNCIRLENIDLGKATSIGPYCFNGCISLKNVEIPDTVTSIEEGSFAGCTTLEKVIIPSSVESIGFQAWANCSALTEIKIPSSVQTIGYNCFMNSCTTDAMLYVPFTAAEGAPAGWNSRWNRSKAHFIYSDGTEETDNSKKYM